MRQRSWFLILTLISLVGCRPAVTQAAPQPTRVPANVNAAEPPQPTPTALPPTPQLVSISATVWSGMPQVPVLMYHHFDPRPGALSKNYTTSLADFDAHLSALYEAGFSLVPLQDWLTGSVTLPEGRRPLILTIDDAFFADQISLGENGSPTNYSGLGRLWQFANARPDFGFSAALFYNFGDKPYSNDYTNGVFSVQDGWRQARAEAIAWSIRHQAIPMNHFYNHPNLSLLTPTEIEWQLAENERALQEALAMAAAEDLAAELPTVLALPYVIWPADEAGKQVLYNYISLEGSPALAIVEADNANNARLLPAPFSQAYDRWHVPRIEADWEGVDAVLAMTDSIPTATACALGRFPIDPSLDPDNIADAIQDRTMSGDCPEGIYQVGSLAFQALDGVVIQLTP